jgi:multicomponent K+:H+ antiporter subunit E
MMRRLFPHPVLTVALFLTWMLLVNHVRVGSLVMAAFLATAIPLFTAPYWPSSPKIRNFPALFAYGALVFWDILVANFVVARIILFMPNSRIQSRWVTVPLDLKSPEAITALASTITLTPGTLTADMSACGRALLIHSLHAPDPDSIRDEIKTRYEARLKRIYE